MSPAGGSIWAHFDELYAVILRVARATNPSKTDPELRALAQDACTVAIEELERMYGQQTPPRFTRPELFAQVCRRAKWRLRDRARWQRRIWRDVDQPKPGSGDAPHPLELLESTQRPIDEQLAAVQLDTKLIKKLRETLAPGERALLEAYVLYHFGTEEDHEGRNERDFVCEHLQITRGILSRRLYRLRIAIRKEREIQAALVMGSARTPPARRKTTHSHRKNWETPEADNVDGAEGGADGLSPTQEET